MENKIKCTHLIAGRGTVSVRREKYAEKNCVCENAGKNHSHHIQESYSARLCDISPDEHFEIIVIGGNDSESIIPARKYAVAGK